MSKKMRVSLILLITVGLLVSLTSAAFAAKKQPFELTYELTMNWLTHQGVGTYELAAPVEDVGDAYLSYTWNGAIPYVMVFKSGEDSFTARMIITNREDACWTGKYMIIGERGTGEYENAYGAGRFSICGVSTQNETVTGELKGWVDW